MSSATMSGNNMSSQTNERETAARENNEKEREFILGNKQLLSVFFVVVVLLGVFFTIGYVMGRSSTAPGTNAEAVTAEAGQDAAPARPSALAEAKSEEAAAPSVTPVVRRAAEVPQLTVIQPAAGQIYLQVLAVAKAEAEVLAEVLAKKGFRALVAPGPNSKVFRVLVGPAKDAEDASRLKSGLESAGFRPFVKKY